MSKIVVERSVVPEASMRILGNNDGKYPLLCSTRCSIYLMFFLTITLQYACRYALNMSIVCMVVPEQEKYMNGSVLEGTDDDRTAGQNLESTCIRSNSAKKDFGFEGEFYWSRPLVGYILAAPYYAYIPMQIIAGILADKFGIRHVLGTGILIGGLMNFLIPVAARQHYGFLIGIRVIMGFAVGVVFPCLHSAVGKWVPPSERSTFFGWAFSGPGAGIIMSFILSGYLCHISWTIIFYLVGGVTILWYVAFLYIVYSSPDDHPRISEEERQYIKSCNRAMERNSKLKIPWRKMLTSRSVLAMCVSHFSSIWVSYTLGNAVPLYLQDVLYFNIKENGVLSSLPHITTLVCSSTVGVACDVIHRRLITSRRVLRKTSETLCAAIVVSCMVAVGYMTCSQRPEAIAMLCLTYFAICFQRGGIQCSPSDVAPRFAGLVYGIMNFVGNFSGFLTPIAIGNLTQNRSQAEWQRVFLLSSAVGGVGWVSFVFFVSSYEEPWAKEESTSTNDEHDEDDMEMNVDLEMKA